MSNEPIWVETRHGELVNLRHLAQIHHDGQGRLVGLGPTLGRLVLHKGEAVECERIRAELGAMLNATKLAELGRALPAREWTLDPALEPHAMLAG